MGLFDALSPFLSNVDGLLSHHLPIWGIIALWGGVAAFISTLLFKKFSDPKKISTLKSQLKTAQQQLNDHDGEFAELKTLATKTMQLSLKRMALTFFPALLASIPVLFLLTHLSNRYDLKQPQPGDQIPIEMIWENEATSPDLLIIRQEKLIAAEHIDHVYWPSDDNQVLLFDKKNDQKIVNLPIPLSTVVHKKMWWNTLIGNPAGYLDDDSHIHHINFEFDKQHVIDIGPIWMRGWLVVFLFFTVSFSVLFMVLFKVKF